MLFTLFGSTKLTTVPFRYQMPSPVCQTSSASIFPPLLNLMIMRPETTGPPAVVVIGLVLNSTGDALACGDGDGEASTVGDGEGEGSREGAAIGSLAGVGVSTVATCGCAALETAGGSDCAVSLEKLR